MCGMSNPPGILCVPEKNILIYFGPSCWSSGSTHDHVPCMDVIYLDYVFRNL